MARTTQRDHERRTIAAFVRDPNTMPLLWARAKQTGDTRPTADLVADAIERGDHHQSAKTDEEAS